jgi:hypothetical protein
MWCCLGGIGFKGFRHGIRFGVCLAAVPIILQSCDAVADPAPSTFDPARPGVDRSTAMIIAHNEREEPLIVSAMVM